MYFDSHAHLDDEKFHEDRKELISKAREEGVDLILNPGADLASSEAAVALAQQYHFLYAGVGVHPHQAKNVNENVYARLKELSQKDKVVAIGEIGLDYHYDNSPREVQKEVFKRQLQLASDMNLPIIIHNREAHGDTYEILGKYFDAENGGVMHSYSGSLEMANRFIDMGLYLSISGPITFKNAKKNVELVREIPLEHLFIETDSPYLTPVPYRGKKNHPAMVQYVAKKIAEIKNISVEEVAEKTKENAKRLFRIS